VLPPHLCWDAIDEHLVYAQVEAVQRHAGLTRRQGDLELRVTAGSCKVGA
jgi:hypothetical protein